MTHFHTPCRTLLGFIIMNESVKINSQYKMICNIQYRLERQNIWRIDDKLWQQAIIKNIKNKRSCNRECILIWVRSEEAFPCSRCGKICLSQIGLVSQPSVCLQSWAFFIYLRSRSQAKPKKLTKNQHRPLWPLEEMNIFACLLIFIPFSTGMP